MPESATLYGYKNSTAQAYAKKYNHEFSAIDLDKYTITYNLDGGQNNSGNPSSYKYITATITLKNPTRTNYIFQGTLGNIDFTAGYIILMIPILFMPYLWRIGRFRLFSLVCGFSGICTVLVSRVVTGRLLIFAFLTGIGMLILFYPPIARRGFLIIACIFFLLTGDSIVGLPWYTGKETFVFSIFSPIRTILYLFCGLACLIGAHLTNRKNGTVVLLHRKTIILLLFIVFFVCIVMLRMIPFTPRNGVLWEIHEILNGRARDSFGHHRWGVWKYSIELFKHNWLFGTGPDTFSWDWLRSRKEYKP